MTETSPLLSSSEATKRLAELGVEPDAIRWYLTNLAEALINVDEEDELGRQIATVLRGYRAFLAADPIKRLLVEVQTLAAIDWDEDHPITGRTHVLEPESNGAKAIRAVCEAWRALGTPFAPDQRARTAAPRSATTPAALAWLEDTAGDLVPLPEETPERGARCPAAHLPIQLVRALMGRAESGKIPLALVYPIEGGYRTVSIGPDGQIKQRVETRVGAFLGGSSTSIGVSPTRAPDLDQDHAAPPSAAVPPIEVKVGPLGSVPAGVRMLELELEPLTKEVDQALAALERKVHAAGFKSVGDMMEQFLAWITGQREQTAVIDGVLSDLDAQLAEVGFPHEDGSSLAGRLRSALASVPPSTTQVRLLLQKVRGAFRDAVANAPTETLGEQRRDAMAALEAFLLAPTGGGVLLGAIAQADRALSAIGAPDRAGTRRLLVGERVESVQRDLLSLVTWLGNAHAAHDEAVGRCMKPDPETKADPDPGLARYHRGKADGLLAVLTEVCTRFPGTALASLTVPPRGRDLVAELLPKLWTLRLALFRLPDSPEEARGLQAVAEALELLGHDEESGGWCGQCENPPACAACGRRRAAAARAPAPDDGDGAVAFVHEVVHRDEDPA